MYRVAATLLCLVSLSTQDITSGGVSLEECDPEMLGFELITGYVFTAPDDLLDSVPGTLMLTDCLEACQSNDSCHAVNYETGLCVLFASNADTFPGKHTFPHSHQGQGFNPFKIYRFPSNFTGCQFASRMFLICN